MKVLFTSSQPYTVLLAKKMLKDGFIPTYFFTSSDTKSIIKKEFPDAITHNYHNAIKGIPARDLHQIELFPINIEMLNYLSQYESIALSMLDRNDSISDSFKHRERLDYYYDILKYWYTIILKLDIKLVYFEEEPHQANDYILYLVTKYLNINTYMSVRTISKLGIIPMRNFEKGSIPLIKLYNKNIEEYENKKTLPELSKHLDKYFKNIRGTYNDILSDHLWDQVEEYNNSIKNKKSETYLFLLFLIKKTFNLKILNERFKMIFEGKFVSDQKEFGKKFSDSKLSYSKYLYHKLRTLLIKKSNKKIYSKMCCKKVDFQKKYIFCTLQYQPEKSTNPLGGVFQKQILMIEMISKIIPKDWVIYIKEHPSQFVTDYLRYGDFFRGKDFYNKIASLKNCILVPIEQNSFDMIDNSIAVASVSGTVLWESVMREKFCLSFGNSWFKGCEGILETRNLNDLRENLNVIKNKIKPELNKVKLFAYTIDSLKFYAAVGGPNHLKIKNLSNEKNAEIHYNAFNWLLKNEI